MFYFRRVREFQSSSLGLEGALLIAHPNLLDPNFRRAVVYIISHDAQDGALGVILNRAMNKTVADLLPSIDLGPLAHVPVFSGGPVSGDRLTFAAFEWLRESQTIECRINVELEEAKLLAMEDDVVLRAFVGYSGWTGGQIEAELDQKTWVVQKPDRELLDPESCKQMWFTIMNDYGPWFRLLAAAPDDPSLN